VPEVEHLNLRAHLKWQTALKQSPKSGNSGMEHIERYVRPSNGGYERAMDKL